MRAAAAETSTSVSTSSSLPLKCLFFEERVRESRETRERTTLTKKAKRREIFSQSALLSLFRASRFLVFMSLSAKEEESRQKKQLTDVSRHISRKLYLLLDFSTTKNALTLSHSHSFSYYINAKRSISHDDHAQGVVVPLLSRGEDDDDEDWLFFFQDDDEAQQNEQTTTSHHQSGTRRSVNLRGQTIRCHLKSQRRRNPRRVHRQSRRERRESGVKIRRRRHVSLVLFRGRVMAGRSAWFFEKRDKRVSEHGGFYRRSRAGRKGVRRKKVTEKAGTAKVWEENERGASGTSVAHLR